MVAAALSTHRQMDTSLIFVDFPGSFSMSFATNLNAFSLEVVGKSI
jgi:hypothetical protein